MIPVFLRSLLATFFASFRSTLQEILSPLLHEASSLPYIHSIISFLTLSANVPLINDLFSRQIHFISHCNSDHTFASHSISTSPTSHWASTKQGQREEINYCLLTLDRYSCWTSICFEYRLSRQALSATLGRSRGQNDHVVTLGRDSL